MDKALIIGCMMFFAIPIIALIDYLIMSPYIEKSFKDYKKYGKLHYMTWLPATILETLFFITGLFLGMVLR